MDMHRKTREIPWGIIVGFIALLVMATGLLTLLSALSSPAAAMTPDRTTMLQPAMAAASQLRPTWDGYQPKRWTGQDPMCPASSAGLHRWARPDKYAPSWGRVECLPDGSGFYAWDAIVKH